MTEHKFEVFGQFIGVVGQQGSWQAFYLGNEGKRRPADFVIPRHLEESQLGEYLADLFHEYATPRNHSVRKLP